MSHFYSCSNADIDFLIDVVIAMTSVFGDVCQIVVLLSPLTLLAHGTSSSLFHSTSLPLLSPRGCSGVVLEASTRLPHPVPPTCSASVKAFNWPVISSLTPGVDSHQAAITLPLMRISARASPRSATRRPVVRRSRVGSPGACWEVHQVSVGEASAAASSRSEEGTSPGVAASPPCDALSDVPV